MTSEKAKKLIEYCREDDRICPMPDAWNDLWHMLPDRVNGRDGWEPPLPLS